MPCNDKMGNVVRGFPTYMGFYGGRGGGGEGEIRDLEGGRKPLVCF